MGRAVRDSVGMCPPLVVTHAEVDLLVDRLGAALDAAVPELGRL